MQEIVNQGLVPSGKVKICFKGKQKELLFMGIKLHDKPSIEHSKKVVKMGQDVVKFMHKREGKKAELVLLEALKLEPKSPDLLYNLAGSYMVQERKKESIELIKKIHQEYPDYSFARLSVAQFHIEDNELEEAEELLKPLFTKTEFNHNEFSKFCELHIKLAMAKKDLKEAHSWLEMWQRMGNEDDELLEYWTEELEDIFSFI